MRAVKTMAGMQRLARQWQRRGLRVGFVPTMGYLHAGHLSLVRAARSRVGARGRVVVSIYVNPIQFAPHEDLGRYPRDMRRDLRRCREAGVDVVFAPSDAEMYPGGKADGFSTFVVEESLSKPMEGKTRPTHFRGVATVVAKLFHAVLPTVAVFGAKDYQQAAVVKRMVRDLNFPVEVMVAPTVRAADGLALSSRNQYLSESERSQASVLFESIRLAGAMVRRARRGVPAERLRRLVAVEVARHASARLDYVAFFDPDTLEPQGRVRRGAHMALAVWMGRTRLIDNGRLE